MSNKNIPNLFIDSVNVVNEGKENQVSFDSRKEVKTSKVSHRIDDLVAMHTYKKNVLSEITTIQGVFEGFIQSFDETKLQFKTEDGLIDILLTDILDVNILKI